MYVNHVVREHTYIVCENTLFLEMDKQRKTCPS